MPNWTLAAIPPILLWFGLFAYLIRVDRKLSRLVVSRPELDPNTNYPRPVALIDPVAPARDDA